MGFSDAYKYNGKTNKAFIIVAVLDEYRGNNIATELIQKTVNNCFNQNYKTIIYRCDSNNTPSKNLAIRNNFSLVKKTNNQLYFELQKPINNNYQYLYHPYYIPYNMAYTYDNNFINDTSDRDNGDGGGE